ncbi:MAG: hypothetical protein OXH52_08925 [Gammaproteobacteria bacterium]|nr:hypothetical protein [Gammaproteobacteria bacterium]
MTTRRESRRQKKVYSAPLIVDFGAIDAMTGDCYGFCLDGMNGGMAWGG